MCARAIRRRKSRKGQECAAGNRRLFQTMPAGASGAAAVGCAVAGRDVDVQAAQAVRAVVAVAAPGALRLHEPSADSAGEAVAAGMGLVVARLVLLSFVFAVHWFLPKAFLRREAWRVWICRPPGQHTRSDVLVCFKQYLLNIEFAILFAAISISRMHAAVKCAQKTAAPVGAAVFHPILSWPAAAARGA